MGVRASVRTTMKYHYFHRLFTDSVKWKMGLTPRLLERKCWDPARWGWWSAFTGALLASVR